MIVDVECPRCNGLGEVLGGCCYDSPEAFMREKGGYFDDMVANAIDMARDAIAQLKQED